MDQDSLSFANLENIDVLEQLYSKWQKNPESLEGDWRYFFDGMQLGAQFPQGAVIQSPDLRIYSLINAYRHYGHLMTQINPLAIDPPVIPRELQLKTLGFSESELSSSFPTCGFLKQETATLKEIIEGLKRTYCGTIGIEYMGLGNPEIEKWIQERIEPFFELCLSSEDKMKILTQLSQAELFELFIHTKYVGQTRFSLEGGETFVPMLHMLLQAAAEEGVSDMIMGMAHRGRLNVLANILGKSFTYIFHEFEDHFDPEGLEGSGDVKYHKGIEGDYVSEGKTVHVILSANPSQLEAVDPVVEGGVRAQQELKGKQKRQEALAVLIHGDAAMAGQGVIYETMQLSKLNGYNTRGTVHIVINNQIGFTTLPKDGRSTLYCTDIAKAFSAPVFHVNAEDPEGCVAVTKMAIQLRQRFGCDVFIDLNCYRKYGHNEGDEPNFTQPVEYKQIKEKRDVLEIYGEKLLQEKILSSEQMDRLKEQFKEKLTKALEAAKQSPTENPRPLQAASQPDLLLKPVETKVSGEKLKSLTQKMCQAPADFNIHPKIQKLLSDRLQMVEGENSSLDWGMGELLAYASLVTQGVHVRLSGQDVRRGTFSHRHAVWVDQNNAKKYFPLSHLETNQAPCDFFNSPLSEYAVMAFEFGYSLIYPNSLVIWEAQYGDFYNGAQIVVDQFIASCEQKWGLKTNLVLMLPHGYEGAGPDHSSGRIERFLQLAGEENMFIANCTTPAQCFHLLRRQALIPIKKPLIFFTPKMLLRFPLCKSTLQEFTQGTFEEILDDPSPGKNPERLLFCSGKIYFDLVQERAKKGSQEVIIRIEQLYPLHLEKLKTILKKYPQTKKCVWIQEEPENMGAWEYIQPQFAKILGGIPLEYCGRARSASTSTGSHRQHKLEQQKILDKIFKD